MAKINDIKASFTGREMEAIVKMLLSKEGINVDPIIEDMYPDLPESTKSMFRCKIALMLSGKLPEFQAYEGFRQNSSKTVYKYRCTGESSLLGLKFFEVIEVWEVSDDASWKLKENHSSIGNKRSENIDYVLYDSIDEAYNKW